MTVRWLLSVALVANVLVLAASTERTTSTTTSSSSASANSSSSSSYASSRSSATSVVVSQPRKCRKVKKCPKNEELSSCPQSIQRPQNCSEKAENFASRDRPSKPCKKGCVCKEKYLRAENGTCIPAEQSGVCPENERYSTCIQAECRALNCTQKDQSVPCIRLNPLCCKKGCVCQEGYLRNKDGVCVLKEKCEPNCPANEEFVQCMQGVCRAKECSERGQDVPCPDIPMEKCDSGCICKEKFLRAANGTCVPEDQCETKVCPTNEEWSTCAQTTCRQLNCTQRGQPVACPMIMEDFCEKACVCKENYLRNANGDCVPEDQCPCDENEILEKCPTSCNTDYCPVSADEEAVCTTADPCVPTCKCRFNYKRGPNRICIPTRECPPFDCSAKPYEEYVACPPICPTDECGQPRLKGRCPFRIGIILKCNPKCQCKDGYGRVNGTCVPFEECPNLCPANEEYSPCVQQTCRPQNCSDRDLAMDTCPSCDAAECQRGCVCQENYYRDDKGRCVSYKECGGPLSTTVQK